MATQRTQSKVTPQDIAYLFLQYAREDYSAIQNATFPVSNAGGSALGTWDTPVQDYAAWCTSIDLMISMTLTVTVPAGQAYTWSQYLPYNLLQASLLIGGSESIPPMSLVPFWLDEITFRNDGFDPVLYGPGNPVAGPVIPAVWMDDGSSVAEVLAVLLPVTPGSTTTNGGTATTVTSFTFQFYVRILLGRNLYAKIQENLVGCVPLGDPSSRPLLNLKLPTFVGTQPENNPVLNAGAGVTVTTHASTQCFARALWRSITLDQLPPALGGGIPTPKVMMALEVDTNSGFAIPNAGQFTKLQIRTAMLYHKRFEVLINNQAAVNPDYTGMWYSDNRNNARYEYDALNNTLQEKYRRYQTRYGRYLPKGVTAHDFIGGEHPDVPMFTPYRGVVTPSVALANLANLKPYPAAETVTRIPSGTVISSAYVTGYDFGLVPVAY